MVSNNIIVRTIICDILPIKDTILIKKKKKKKKKKKSVNIIEGPLHLHSSEFQLFWFQLFLCFLVDIRMVRNRKPIFFIFLLFSFYLFPSHLNLLGKLHALSPISHWVLLNSHFNL